MRKEAKQQKHIEIAHIQGYHGGHWGSQHYAFEGFKTNRYYTSDRTIKLDADFRTPDGKPLKGFGLEIEIECYGIKQEDALADVCDKIIAAQFPDDLFKMQHDGSLAGDTSVEMITQVMTKAFIRNNYASFKAMYDHYFPAFQMKCGDSCGMHVNISNALFGATEATQAEAIKKLLYITNKHYNLMLTMLKRKPGCNGYCAQMPQFSTMEGAKNADLHHMPGSHGNCFNGSHYDAGRVELRLPGGQLSYVAFRNTMETVFHLVDAVKRLSWSDCDDVVKIFSGCNRYVDQRLTDARREGKITDAQYSAIHATADMTPVYDLAA